VVSGWSGTFCVVDSILALQVEGCVGRYDWLTVANDTTFAVLATGYCQRPQTPLKVDTCVKTICNLWFHHLIHLGCIGYFADIGFFWLVMLVKGGITGFDGVSRFLKIDSTCYFQL